MKNYKVLTLNPGSTSTKIALFEGKSVYIRKTYPMMRENWKSSLPLVSSFRIVVI